MIQVDYSSENYVNKDQAQIQHAYFGLKLFSIITTCCYLNNDGIIINENVTISMQANNHLSAAMSYWRHILFCIRESAGGFVDSSYLK